MKLNTNNTSDRLPQVTLSANSILRIHEGMKTGKKLATQNTASEVSAKYDALLARGDDFATYLSSISGVASEVQPIDRAIDRIIGGLDDVSRGLQKIYDADSVISLTSEEQTAAQDATKFAQTALPNGTKFILGPWRAEWAEIAQMLARLKAPDASMRVGPLDLSPIIARLTRAHDVYGKALKIVQSEDTPQPILTSIEAWGEALDDLDTAVSYHHKKDAALRAQIFSAFFAELQYLEEASAKERAKQRLSDTKQAPKEEPTPSKDE
jgi:hypothetical protein